ncbi:MAG: hypothetical protein ACFE8P_15595, partial [Promethearchaeota archaeon]
FKFPDIDRGGYKYLGKTIGSNGPIIDKIRVSDKVIWTISGNSGRKDKKNFWGFGTIIGVNREEKHWNIKSTEFPDKSKIDDVVYEMEEEYQRLYILSNGIVNLGRYGAILIDEYQYKTILDHFGFVEQQDKLENEPALVIMNINPENIENCIKNTIHGARSNTAAAGNVEKLNKGDICIVRKTSGGGKFQYGVNGIWYFSHYEDLEGNSEPLWIPPDGWKYKIIMKPLVKEFNKIFEEDFSKDVEGQLRHKESTKVSDLKQTDIQGAVRMNFRDSDLPMRYLKAILVEKSEECDIITEYEDFQGKKHKINVYRFLDNLTQNIYDIEPQSTIETEIPQISEENKQKQEIQEENMIIPLKKEIFFGTAGYWEVNQFHYKIKIQNNTETVITDIKILLENFPPMLKLIGPDVKKTMVLSPKGAIWTPEFILDAGNECVNGKIYSSVRYFDHKANKHSNDLPVHEISYICPLLEAKKISEEEYEEKLKKMIFKEEKIQFENSFEISLFLQEVASKMEGMNLALVEKIKSSNAELIGYAEDKIKRDALALEAKFQVIEGSIELILKALCEQENKCPALLHKALEEINTIGLSLNKSIIMIKLDMIIDKPEDLSKYLKRVLKSKWTNDKKDQWANSIKEILEEWRQIRPKRWQRALKILGKTFASILVGETVVSLISEGVQNLYEWIKKNLE